MFRAEAQRRIHCGGRKNCAEVALLQGADAVAEGGGALEFEILGGFAHLRFELSDGLEQLRFGGDFADDARRPPGR